MKPNASPNPPPTRGQTNNPGPQEPLRVEGTDEEGHRTGREDFGLQVGRAEGGSGRGQAGTDPQEVRNHLRDGSHPRVPDQDLGFVALRSFQTGNPSEVYRHVQELAQAYQDSLDEAAELRFKLNFGSEICGSCEGLRAGPGVIATCYQVRKCNFSNVKEGDSRYRRVIDRLTGDLTSKVPV